MKDKKELFKKIKTLNSMIEDYLDRMEMDEADEKSETMKKKEDK